MKFANGKLLCVVLLLTHFMVEQKILSVMDPEGKAVLKILRAYQNLCL